jgi:Flp pilus assembly pilin Flp
VLRLINRLVTDENGVTAIEYGLVAVLIAFAACGARRSLMSAPPAELLATQPGTNPRAAQT